MTRKEWSDIANTLSGISTQWWPEKYVGHLKEAIDLCWAASRLPEDVDPIEALDAAGRAHEKAQDE